MIKICENCPATYDTERAGGNEFFCPKCIGYEIAVNNNWEVKENHN